MNTTQKIAAATAAVTATSAGVGVLFHNYHQDIYSRFPEVDRKIARKAFRRMLLTSFSGLYTNDQLATDESMDQLFLQQVRDLTRK